MKTTMKRIFSLLIVLVMVCGMLPMSAIHTHAATGNYVKVTAKPTDWSGTYLIVYEDESFAFNGSLSKLDAANNYTKVTITDDKIAATDALKSASFTIDAKGHIKSASGYYIGQTSNANGLNSNTTTKYENTITVANNGDIDIKSSGGAYLRFNTTSGQDRFRYYKSSSYASQKPICLYKLEEAEGGGDPETPECTHENTTTTTEDATCTEAGSITVTCNDCGEVVSTTEISATGHSYGEGIQCTAPGCGYYKPDSLLTFEQATAFGKSRDEKTSDMYYVEGVIVELIAEENSGEVYYGNTYICDADGNKFYIYGIKDSADKFYGDMEGVKPANGDYVKLYGAISQYKGLAQMHHGVLVAHCAHTEENTTYKVEKESTCVEEGVGRWTCTNGHSYPVIIPKSGHSYVEVDGVFDCKDCDDSYNAITVTFDVPAGVASVESMKNEIDAKLPAAETVENYTFVGWVTAPITEESTEKPAEIYAEGTDIKATFTENTKLYALYQYTKTEEGVTPSWNLVTDADSLKDGAQIIIVAAGYDYALSTNQKTSNRGAIAVVKDGEQIAERPADAQVLTLQKDADTGLWALYTGEGYLYAPSSSSNQLKTQTENNANGLWEIAIATDNVASIVARDSSNRNVMQYNPNNGGDPLFACYAADKPQQPLSIYMYKAAGTNYYITEIAPKVVDYVKEYNVELTDKIGMNFMLSADVTSATVTFGGETTTVALDTLPTDKNGLRIYSLKMAAAQMADEVVWLFNGKTEATYSVRGYADVVLSGEYGVNEKAMVRAMLHYGAAAQDYFNYNDGNYANAGMTDTVTNPIQAVEMVPTTGETAGIVHYGSTLVYRDRVAVRVYFMLTGDAAIDTFTFTANGEAVEAQEGSNGLYYVEIADIAPQNLDKAVTVTVNDGLTVTYSALNYIYRMVNKTEDNALKTLLQQLYDYYMAAEYLDKNGPDDFETEPDVVG